MTPTIASIVHRPKETTLPQPKVGYLRVPLTETTLIEGSGIENDAKALPQRNLNIMDTITQAELKAEGLPTGPGILGENILFDGLDLRGVPNGTQLRLGAEAVIEVVERRNGCQRLTAMDARMPECTRGRVGVMARVVRSGRIKVGDRIEVVEAVKP